MTAEEDVDEPAQHVNAQTNGLTQRQMRPRREVVDETLIGSDADTDNKRDETSGRQ